MKRILSGLMAVSLLAGGLLAAPSFDSLLEDYYLSSEQALEDYVEPLTDALAQGASTATFHSAGSKGLLGLDLGIKLQTLSFASGDQTDILDDNGVSAAVLPVLFVNKGLVGGWMIGARGMSYEMNDEVGKLTLLGALVRWEANELFDIPLVMPRVGLQANFNRLMVGDHLTTDALTFDLLVSKQLLMFGPYAGYSFGKATTNLDFTSSNNLPVDLDVDATIGRLTLGMNFTPFPLLRINAEYGMGAYDTYTVGLLFNLF